MARNNPDAGRVLFCKVPPPGGKVTIYGGGQVETGAKAYTFAKNANNNPLTGGLAAVEYGISALDILLKALGAAGTAALIDGPLPVGDIIGAVILGVGVVWAGGVLISDGITLINEQIAHASKTAELPPDAGYEYDGSKSGTLPQTGDENTYQEKRDEKTDELLQRRYYGEDGRASYDTDYNHSGEGHVFPHDHYWDWNNQETPRGKGVEDESKYTYDK